MGLRLRRDPLGNNYGVDVKWSVLDSPISKPYPAFNACSVRNAIKMSCDVPAKSPAIVSRQGCRRLVCRFALKTFPLCRAPDAFAERRERLNWKQS
jgi:hypothetical protein